MILTLLSGKYDKDSSSITPCPAPSFLLESYDFYQFCQFTERNKGLYTADQNILRNDKRGTRQNPQGNRHGFECPEERDYYPWWHPSPWVDIAVLSDSASDQVCCAWYNNIKYR